MGDDRLDLAEALLAKARSTAFEAERDSFVAGAYSQLGSFLDSAPVSLPRYSRPGQPSPRAVRVTGTPALPAPPAPPKLSEPVPPLPAPAPIVDPTEPVPVVDLTALEAYQATTVHPDRRGVLIDLTI